MLKYLIPAISLFLSGHLVYGQSATTQPDVELEFSHVLAESFDNVQLSETPLSADATEVSGKKSRFLGIVYSLLLPGMGELYADRFDRGRIPLIVEGFLWLGFTGLTLYSDNVADNAITFAQQHAGIDPDGKDDDFFNNVENHINVYAYNDTKLNFRELDALYPTGRGDGYYWQWDTDENRADYEDQRILADNLSNSVSFVILGMVANRIWSAIQASIAVKDYNESLNMQSSLPEMNAHITTYQGKTDGIRFDFQQRF